MSVESSLSRRNPLNPPLRRKESSTEIEQNLFELGILGHRTRKKSSHHKGKPTKTVEFGSTVAHSN